MNKALLSLVLLIISSLTMAGCFVTDTVDEDGTTPTPTATITSTPTEEEPTVSPTDEESDIVDADVEMEITTRNFEFSEELIEANPGDTVVVNLTNEEGTHDFVIDELEVASETLEEQGDTDTVVFTIPDDAVSGDEYAFYCSIGEHREMGMEGTIVIL